MSPAVLYIHPSGYPLANAVPVGVLSNLNTLDVPRLGLHQHEVTDDDLRSARVIALSIHWYFPLAGTLDYIGYIKRTNPQATIIVGGLTANIYADLIAQSAPVDYVLAGDTEGVFARVVHAVLEGRPKEEIATFPGVWTVIKSPAAPCQLDNRAYNTLDWLSHDWFPSLALHVRLSHARHIPGEATFDNVHPHIPLMRGCPHPCQFCYGHYQRFVFAREALSLSDEAVLASLDEIVERGYRFVSFLNGFEIMGVLRGGGFRKRYPLSVSLMICFLPSREMIQNLVDSFDFVLLWLSYPEDDLLFLQLQRQQDSDFIEHFHATFASVTATNLKVILSRVDVSSKSRTGFEERLREHPIPSFEYRENFDWDLPMPRRAPYHGESLDEQFQRFLTFSREYGNFNLAGRFLPECRAIFERWEAMRNPVAHDPAIEPRFAPLREAAQTYYEERKVSGIARFLLAARPLAGATVPAGLSWIALQTPAGAEGVDEQQALFEACWDWHVPYVSIPLTDLHRTEGGLLLVPYAYAAPDHDRPVPVLQAIAVRWPDAMSAAGRLRVAITPADLVATLLDAEDSPLFEAVLPLARPVQARHQVVDGQQWPRALAAHVERMIGQDKRLAGATVEALRFSVQVNQPGGAGALHIRPRAGVHEILFGEVFGICRQGGAENDMGAADESFANALLDSVRAYESELIRTSIPGTPAVAGDMTPSNPIKTIADLESDQDIIKYVDSILGSEIRPAAFLLFKSVGNTPPVLVGLTPVEKTAKFFRAVGPVAITYYQADEERQAVEDAGVVVLMKQLLDFLRASRGDGTQGALELQQAVLAGFASAQWQLTASGMMTD